MQVSVYGFVLPNHPIIAQLTPKDMADTPDEETTHQAEPQRLQHGPEPMRVFKHPYLDGQSLRPSVLVLKVDDPHSH